MKNILLTGYKPFLSNESNPSELIVESLSNHYDARVLDVVYKDVFEFVAGLDPEEYDFIVCLGLHAKAEKPRLERFAYNEITDKAADNAEVIPSNPRIISEGPDRLETSLLLDNLQSRLLTKGFDTDISEDAGRYLCNYIYYLSLMKSGGRALFIHLPPISENNSFEKLKSLVEHSLKYILA